MEIAVDADGEDPRRARAVDPRDRRVRAVGHRAAVDHRDDGAGAVRDPAFQARRRLGVHQQDPDDAGARRGPARGGDDDGAADGPRRARARSSIPPRCAGATSSSPSRCPTTSASSSATAGRSPTTAATIRRARRARWRLRTTTAFAARQAAGAQGRPLSRHRDLERGRGDRARAVRGRDGARLDLRQDRRLHRRRRRRGSRTRPRSRRSRPTSSASTIDDVTVVTADTAAISLGMGTFAARTAVNAGSSVHLAAAAVAEKAKKLAAGMMECVEDDLELAGGLRAAEKRSRRAQEPARDRGESDRHAGLLDGGRARRRGWSTRRISRPSSRSTRTARTSPKSKSTSRPAR